MKITIVPKLAKPTTREHTLEVTTFDSIPDTHFEFSKLPPGDMLSFGIALVENDPKLRTIIKVEHKKNVLFIANYRNIVQHVLSTYTRKELAEVHLHEAVAEYGEMKVELTLLYTSEFTKEEETYLDVIKKLKGSIIESISGLSIGSECLMLNTSKGRLTLEHNQICCEEVSIEEITGVTDIVSSTILDFKIKTTPVDHARTEILTTRYALITSKGNLDIVWLGETSHDHDIDVDLTFIER